jgi:hypothetical protein
MAQISKSAATLRISGDNLIPSEITSILGCKPSFEQIKGQEIVGKNTGHKRIALTGMWRLQAKKYEPENLDLQISEIFEQLSKDINKWEILSSKYDMDLFCGIFMEKEMEGMDVSVTSLKTLSERGIRLGLDIYGPDDKA